MSAGGMHEDSSSPGQVGSPSAHHRSGRVAVPSVRRSVLPVLRHDCRCCALGGMEAGKAPPRTAQLTTRRRALPSGAVSFERSPGLWDRFFK